MEVFSWKAKNDEGQKVIYQASHFGGWWQLESAPKVGRALKDDVVFESAEFSEEIWGDLREILWRKYQRRRVAWIMVQNIDNILAGKCKNERRDRRGL